MPAAIETPRQAPAEQVSLVVQALPSSHTVPLATAVNTHPVAGLQLSVVQALLSLQLDAAPPTQAPAEQVSLFVQALPSLHGAVLLVCTHPVAGLQESSVQTFASSQLVAAPPTQAPAAQVSLVVQALASLQAAVLLVYTQPVAGVQVSVVHTLLSLQVIAVPPQTPAVHTSPLVQALPSSHTVPLVTLVNTQPVVGAQVSVVHTLLSLQVIAVPPQTPAVHTSPLVQALPSLHTVPLATLVNTQPVAGSQVSVVQGMLSLQTIPVPAHTPAVHTSPEVQALSSLHGAVLLVNTQPVAVSQVSSVQGLLSLQVIPVPAHTPAVHTSPEVQAIPSLHTVPAVTLVNTQPVAWSQVSVVQGLLSLQVIAVPLHTPAEQASSLVQALPSLHVLVSSLVRPDLGTSHLGSAPLSGSLVVGRRTERAGVAFSFAFSLGAVRGDQTDRTRE